LAAIKSKNLIVVSVNGKMQNYLVILDEEKFNIEKYIENFLLM